MKLHAHPDPDYMHLLAWHVLGVRQHRITEGVPLSHDERILETMARAAIYGALNGITRRSGPRLTPAAFGTQFAQADGRHASVEHMTLVSWNDERNTAENTAALRSDLQAAWQTMEPHFVDTGRLCGLGREQTLRATGYLVVPQPSDAALPDMDRYIMAAGLQLPL